MFKDEKVLTSSSEVEPLIEIKNLYGVYNEFKESQLVSLTDISYQFFKDKIYFIIGNSGCGKSTLVSHLNGLLVSNYGSVKIENKYKISKEIFVQDEFLGVIDLETIKHINSLNHQVTTFKNHHLNSQIFLVAFKKDLPWHLIKLLFEAYYKIHVNKLQRIYYPEVKQFLYVLSCKSEEFILEIKDYLSLSELKNLPYLENSKLLWQLKKLAMYLKMKFGSKKIKKVKKIRKNVSMVFQFPEYQIFKDTILKDVMFGPLALGVEKKVALERAQYYLKELSIPENYYERSPFGLSGGQKRRVALAGILSIDPKVLIFDEPTAGLDPVGEEEMLSLIFKAKERHQTVIVITHTMDHVLRAADEVIVMNDGEIIMNGTPYEIFRNEELLKKTSIDRPKIIQTIYELEQRDIRFKKLYDYEPRTVEQLASSIKDLFDQLDKDIQDE